MSSYSTRADAEVLIDSLIKEGKPIACSRERFIKMVMTHPFETGLLIASIPTKKSSL